MRVLIAWCLALFLALPAVAQDYYVYVAAESDDEVALVRFDGTDAEVAKRIPVGFLPTENEGPHGLTIDPSGTHWYLTLAHGQPYGTLLKYRTGTDELEGRATLGLFPATMAVSPATGLLYAVNFNLHGKMEPSTVSVVDPEVMAEVATIETGVMPHGARLEPSGRYLYTMAMMSGMLYEIDAATFEIARSLYVGEGEAPAHGAHAGMEHGAANPSVADHSAMPAHLKAAAPTPKPTWVAPHPTAPRVYIANNGVGEIVEVDTDAWTVTRRWPSGQGPYNLAITPDGAQLVATYKSEGAVGIWDLESGSEVARIASTRRVPHGVEISPDGRYAFVSVEGVGGEPGAVDVIDLERLERVASVDVGKQAGGIVFWKQTDAP